MGRKKAQDEFMARDQRAKNNFNLRFYLIQVV